jgi:hypothetical protein
MKSRLAELDMTQPQLVPALARGVYDTPELLFNTAQRRRSDQTPRRGV